METPSFWRLLKENNIWKDPIVEEIHAVREQIARECDYDLKQIIERLRKKEEEYSGRIVRKEDLIAGHVGIQS